MFWYGGVGRRHPEGGLEDHFLKYVPWQEYKKQENFAFPLAQLLLRVLSLWLQGQQMIMKLYPLLPNKNKTAERTKL